MLSIVSHAQPAELMLALATGHVHATLVLLDGPLALRAWLRVDLQPVLRIVLSAADAILPRGEGVTINR